MQADEVLSETAFFTATGVAPLLRPLLAGFITAVSGDSMWCIVFALATGLIGFAVILPLGRYPDRQHAPVDTADGD